MFQGFSQGSVDFLWGIRFNNERSWFLEHKQEYLTLVDAPLRELADQVGEAMREAYPKLDLMVKVSRIYRDARRLHGRGPYKDHLWFSLRRPGQREGGAPCFYFELAPEYYSYGMGAYDPTPLTMAKLRARMDRDPKPMERLTRDLARQTEFSLETENYKRPRSAPSRPALAPWYQAKSFAITHQDKLTDELFCRDIVEHVKQGFSFLLPYYDYFVTLDSDPDPREL